MQRWCLLSYLGYQSCSFWWILCSCNYSLVPFITAPSLSCSHRCNTLHWNSTAHLLPSKGPQLLMPRFSASLHSTPSKGCTCLLYPLNLISSQSLLWALVPTAPGTLLLMGYCDVRVHCWSQSFGPPVVHSAAFGIANLLYEKLPSNSDFPLISLTAGAQSPLLVQPLPILLFPVILILFVIIYLVSLLSVFTRTRIFSLIFAPW